MTFTRFFFLLLLVGAITAPAKIDAQNANSNDKYVWKQATSGGYTYKYVTNDPLQTRLYTLSNGLTVLLSANHKEPRVAVRIAVRAGSNTDPRDHTGLAHYLEHLLFKGTDQFGSLDWAKEKPNLDKIDALYEQYNSTKDPAARKLIYHRIDSVSGLASHYSIANEYDKLMADIGSQGSNAHTWVEETVYEEDVPSNAMDKFLAVQAERFRNPIFRLFHTELEAVYEEKNRTLDNDGSKMQEATQRYLFPTHNYGQQTTIGTIEHLKNPSLKAIRAYYHAYYVPNNMAVIMSGDFDFDDLIKKIDKSFAYMQSKPVQLYNPAPERDLAAPVTKDIFGPSAENMRIAYRTPAVDTHDAVVLDLISSIFSNGKAGLLDLNLNKQQKVQSSNAGLQQYKDYGMLILNGTPKQGQTLEQVRDLLMEQIEKLKKGEFDESLIKAIVANGKLSLLEGFQKNEARVGALMESFIQTRATKWDEDVAELDEEAQVTKQEVIRVANKYMGNNYVLLYKRKGEDKSIVKVDKPPITPVETNKDKQSVFLKKIEAMQVSPVSPQWLDFTSGIGRGKAGIADVLYVQNKDNELFHLYYRLEMGNYNNRLLPLAAQYLQYLGTAQHPTAEISKAFYDIACNFSVNATNEVTTISVTGLQENFSKAVTLFEDVLHNCLPDSVALASLKDRLMKARANNKLNKNAIMQGLINYARYGAKNPFNTVLSADEIAAIKAEDLTGILHGLLNYPHTIIYYGPLAQDAFISSITSLHSLPTAWAPYPEKVKYPFAVQSANQVLFANYDMVQSEICWIHNSIPYDVNKEPIVDVFDNYFGGGMGSVVFQTLRESKALAYATYATYGTPAKKEDPFYILAYIGCQADKMNDAVGGMNALLNDLPTSDQGFELARTSEKKDIETQRFTEDGIVFAYLEAKQKGLDYDERKNEYETLDKLTMNDVKQFHQQQVAGKAYTYCVVASEKKIKVDDLQKVGAVQVLSLDQIFGY
ncbi:M16 family metallopeptidase [Puia dinghuensis]|uniref:Peptidase M16 n=1 Tax=Puia dinghuensis TaxID=1792502 RepID=A0A8J2UGG9_9BACT|nr:M16 family metallopeptidase [Puia dinghuensis]GGB14450.1 peptidase M16 [Puia dinghuensis]